MTTRRLAVPLPEVVLDALYAEASRVCASPQQVAADVLRRALPAFVGQRLERDLAPVLDAVGFEDEAADLASHAATPPALTDGATNISTLTKVTRSVAPGGPNTGPSDDRPA
jgi:hypothetical protein